MTPPSPSTRGVPAGKRISDGYQTFVVFAGFRELGFWERTVTPPGLDGGAEIDTTTMHNRHYRTKAPRQLKDMTPFSMTASYDPAVYADMVSMINVPTTVTVIFPDGSSVCFYGFLKSFKMGSLEEGKLPEATAEVVPTNMDSPLSPLAA